MFERHFGLRENPFPAGHQLRFLYPSREHQEARAHLRYGIENREPFVLITGEVGTGKTTALYDALAEWGNQIQVALITNSALTRQELLEEICLRFGVQIPPGASKPHALVALERHLNAIRARGEWAVLLLDEAQNLAMDLLEEIRLLSNVEAQGEKLLQIFLVGQPELELKLSRAELRQLRQRITVHYRLNPLSPEETAGYIHHRISVAGGNAWVAFPPDACREVYRITHGIPREINTVASAAMLAAYTENAPGVRPEHVHSVARESEFRSVLGGGALEAPDMPANPMHEEPTPAPPPAPAPAPIARTPVAPPPQRPTPRPEPRVSATEAPPTASWSATRTPAAAPTPPAPTTPAWEPPALDTPPPSVERVAPEELDAWSAAARELMHARRRGPGEPAAPAPPVAPQPPPRSAIAQAAAAAPPPAPPAFPTPEQLEARPAPDPYAEPDYASLPPSLREKLERADAPRRRGPSPVLVAIGVIAVAVIAVAAMLWQRFGGLGTPPEPSANEQVTPAPSGALPASETPNASAPVETLATPAATTAPVTRPAPVAVAPAPAPAPAASTPPPAPARVDSVSYGIAVAQFLNEERAQEERTRLAGETSLSGRLVTYRDAGVTMYRLVLGSFRSEAAAEARAGQLLDAHLVEQASVVPLNRGSR